VTPEEILRRGYEAFNRGDAEVLYAMMEPDFVWHEAPEVPGPKEAIGREEFAGYLRGFDRLWDEFSFELVEVVEPEREDEPVLARVRGRGRGRGGGAEVELEIFHVWKLHGDCVARMDAFLDERAARDAAGLE
jgi:ketosteroid isomerase-like protein